MRKLFIVLMILLLGFSGISFAKDDCKCSEDGIQRTMEIKNDSGEYSGMTFVDNGIGYMRIWSVLGSTDSAFLWNDLTLMRSRGVKHIEIYINSGGGSAFDGMSVADQFENFIKQGGSVIAHASGLVASATVPIYAVCSKRYATKGTIFMVHESAMFKYITNESKSDIESQKRLMDMLESTYVDRLVKYSKISSEDWHKKIKDTTWFSVAEAKDWGLVDFIE